MDLSGASSLYDQALGSIDQQKKMDMSTAANLKNLGSNLKNLGSAVGGFIKGNRTAAKTGEPGTGLFGKEGGFMSKFMTGQGWFSEAFEPHKSAINTTSYTPKETNPISFEKPGGLSELFDINQDPFNQNPLYKQNKEFEETL